MSVAMAEYHISNMDKYYCLNAASKYKYFTVDEKRFLLAYSAKAINITDTTLNGILHHFYSNLVLEKVETIDTVLKVIKELKLDLWSMFKKELEGKHVDLSHCCLLRNPDAFIRITEAGASNGSTNAIRIYQLSLLEILFRNPEAFIRGYNGPLLGYPSELSFFPLFLNFLNYNTWIENWDDISRNPLKFRALQFLNLHMRFTYITRKSAETEMAVRVLWSSIPDPLLTFTDIFRLFEGVDPMYYQEINNIWQWYCNLVNYEESSVRRPRSLKHLSRCFIRNQLGDNFKLPEGVEELGIPKPVQKYLLLRDFHKIE
ncbi:uncharacterized protein [Parasteatoda tepidariorum]|uniref:uncharacterized protein isoform X1 n=1 Tax=Parasteatoda tepidariorum TaxID=114398 RepID=UPI00077FB25A|nr:uncharacterized protein LOC107441835 isoform X1 [Parasteatoda tepidariorum]